MIVDSQRKKAGFVGLPVKQRDPVHQTNERRIDGVENCLITSNALRFLRDSRVARQNHENDLAVPTAGCGHHLRQGVLEVR